MDRRSWTLLIVLAAIWGASYLFIKIGLRDLDALMIAFLRIVLAALVIAPLAARRNAMAGLGERLGLLVLLAVVQAAGPFVLIAAGEEEISSSLAGILVASTPIFTALLAIRFDQEERARGLRLVGVGTGVVGVVVLLGVDLGGSGAALLGGLAIVLASLGYAIGGFMVKHRFAEVEPIGIAAGVMIASTIMMAPFAALSLPEQAPALGPIAAVAALGILGTGVAWIIFYDLMRQIGPARTFVVTYLAPAFAVFYGALLLDEAVTVATLTGLMLIVGGSFLAAEGRLPGASRPPAADVPPPPGGEAAALTGIAPRQAPREAHRGG